MPDVFTKTTRSQVMSLIHGRGNKKTEIALMQFFRCQGIEGLASPWVSIRQARFCLPQTQTGHFCGRMLLALLPKALESTGEQRRILEAQAGSEY